MIGKKEGTLTRLSSIAVFASFFFPLSLTFIPVISGENPTPEISVHEDFEKRESFLKMGGTRTYLANVSKGYSVEFEVKVKPHAEDEPPYPMDILVNSTAVWEESVKNKKKIPFLGALNVSYYKRGFNGPTLVYLTVDNSNNPCPPQQCTPTEGPLVYDIKIVFSDQLIIEQPGVFNLNPLVISALIGLLGVVIFINQKLQ